MNGMILGMMFAALAMIASAGYLPPQPSADNNALALADDLLDGDDGYDGGYDGGYGGVYGGYGSYDRDVNRNRNLNRDANANANANRGENQSRNRNRAASASDVEDNVYIQNRNENSNDNEDDIVVDYNRRHHDNYGYGHASYGGSYGASYGGSKYGAGYSKPAYEYKPSYPTYAPVKKSYGKKSYGGYDNDDNEARAVARNDDGYGSRYGAHHEAYGNRYDDNDNTARAVAREGRDSFYPTSYKRTYVL